ncbi:MAG TPA: hypothetical protein VHO70_18955 [Chitinispirillaceae bacterium]|nr:hypothetical protein [Chitinispirillaceae bacterium]
MKTAFVPVLSLLTAVIFTVKADSLSVPLKNYQESTTYNFAYSRDGNYRADFCTDSTLRIYDIRTGQLQKKIQLPTNNMTLYKKSYTSSNQELISGSDSTIYRIDIAEGLVSAFRPPFSAGVRPLYFSDDYTKMISCDSVYRLWNLNSGTGRECFADLDTVEFAVFSPDNQFVLLVREADSSAQLRSTETDSIMMTYHIPSSLLSSATFSPDGDKFLVPILTRAGASTAFAVMNVNSGDLIRIDTTAQNSSCKIGWVWPHEVVLVYSMDQSRIIQADDDNVCVLDAETGEYMASFCGGSPSFGGTQAYGFLNNPSWFSPDGDSVFIPTNHSGSKVSKLVVLETATNRKTVKYFRQDRPAVRSSGFSECGQPLFVGRYSYTEYSSGAGFYDFDTLVYWNGETDTEFKSRMRVTQPEGVGSYYYENYFTPDGRRMIQQFGSRGSLEIFNITDTCLRIAKTGSGVLSQDMKAVYVLGRDSCSVTDIETGSVTSYPLKCKNRKICAAYGDLIGVYYMKDTADFSDGVLYFGLWNSKSGDSIFEVIVDRIRWALKDSDNWIYAGIINSGTEIVISSPNALQIIDAATGLYKKTISGKGSQFLTFSPDCRQFIAGNGCYEASTGGLQRVYNFPRDGHVSFNPVNPRQFILGATIWELPALSLGTSGTNHYLSMKLNVTALNSGNLVLQLPFTQNKRCGKYSFMIFRMDGRMVMKKLVEYAAARQVIAVPGLSCGTYLYRLEVPWEKKHFGGKLLIP